MTSSRAVIAVGMSGGVDSSVAAALLVAAGHRVVGVTMAIWDGSTAVAEGSKHACFCAGEEEEIATAARVAERIGIPFHVIDLRQEYRAEVLDHFRREYLAGRTPNPCVRCNHLMKFGFLLERARAQGLSFDRFATGHYARVVPGADRLFLKKAYDTAKDQSYFLQFLTRDQLGSVLFPLGEKTKGEVRETARRLGLPVAERPDSQDFIAGDYGILFSPEEAPPGDIVNEKGALLGRHRGIVHYTVGQRRGLGVDGGKPLYVTAIDARNNRIVVTDKDHLFGRGLVAGQVNWLGMDRPDRPFRAHARIRQKHSEAPATVIPRDDGTITVRFDEPQLSITPGQAVALYADDTVLAGATISQRTDEGADT
ncbi:MAG TPA: tRNA 2-thiouridine(34) synthase MnmA [bacterium]|nr:tRNA 2-thiouridine(34) synthase MnmA [bacterium]